MRGRGAEGGQTEAEQKGGPNAIVWSGDIDTCECRTLMRPNINSIRDGNPLLVQLLTPDFGFGVWGSALRTCHVK